MLQPLVSVFTNQRYEVVGENTDHRLETGAIEATFPNKKATR
ncbi:MAG TPA: hypothetical protein PLD84_12660 [Chitinophagales bacterium]|nr:hypothetical protein [Chitinophagales bacterium]